jgi:cytochrome-b5 reductase
LTHTIPGPSGFINADLVKKHVAPASLNEKVKVFICGMLFLLPNGGIDQKMTRMYSGPPGQVAAVAGKKDGGKQGEVGGILKELGYTKHQVKI